MGTIRVARAGGVWRDKVRRYDVVVDGETRARVRDGETVDVQVPGGQHRVRVTIAWTGSPEVVIAVPNDGVVTVSCSARTGASMLPDLFGRTNWVDIGVVPPGA